MLKITSCRCNVLLIFSCCPEEQCGRKNNLITVKSDNFLLTKIAVAENSICSESTHTCCHEDDINTITDPGSLKCADIDGYT